MAEAHVKDVKIEVKRGSLLELEVDAIVNPANSMLTMGGGVAGAIKRAGGEEIEKEAVENAPLPIGKAIVTSAGRLKAKNVIHAPTMEKPGPTTVENIYKATYAALELACNMNFRSIAIPGMGTGVGGLSPNKAAKAMFKALEEHLNKGLKVERIIFIDLNEEVVNAFKKTLKHFIERH
ncbi:macro domain-containing protein [Candidatus Bathyarchaeota archaeon]|nr:macro domain-containing protein [Candidatus Bathyarchaeota archaeon]MBS7613005.1 macro domain-containing protein [Candidatus Bathyarchaeota archaeon]MBS7617581.1 macro domain-containing protein [Candidatus Bathyarchaeota archaeon]